MTTTGEPKTLELQTKITTVAPIEVASMKQKNGILEEVTVENIEEILREGTAVKQVEESFNEVTAMVHNEIPQEVTEVTSEQPIATSTVGEELITTKTATTATTMTHLPQTQLSQPAPRLSGKERESLISYLGNVDLTNMEKLVLTTQQRLAIAPFTDPTP